MIRKEGSSYMNGTGCIWTWSGCLYWQPCAIQSCAIVRVLLNSRLECGGLRTCGVGQLHQPVPTQITRPVPNHTESQCTVIYGCIQPTGCSVHSILPSLSQKRTVPAVAVRLILFCSFSLCCPLKIMSPQGIFFSSSYGCDCMVCRNLELV